MSVALQPLTMQEFLAWEAEQPVKYEFDGIQPVAMTGGSPMHSFIAALLVKEVGKRLEGGPCKVFQSDLPVRTEGGTRLRYPDASVACGSLSDPIAPVVIFEVTSPSTAFVDERIKPREYQSLSSVMVYAMVRSQSREVLAMRRSSGWELERVDRMLELPEVGIILPVAAVYGDELI